jgi:hypothetical protein
MAQTTSSQFTLNWRDAIKGLVVAVLTPIFTTMLNSINQGSLTFNWNLIWISAAGGGLGYILKNFLSPSEVVITNSEIVKAVKEGDVEVKIQDTSTGTLSDAK